MPEYVYTCNKCKKDFSVFLSLKEFEKIVKGNILIEKKKKIMQGIFNKARDVLGIETYEKIKQKYFDWRQGK